MRVYKTGLKGNEDEYFVQQRGPSAAAALLGNVTVKTARKGRNFGIGRTKVTLFGWIVHVQ